MEAVVYSRMLSDVLSNIDKSEVDLCMSIRLRGRRRGRLMDVLREGFISSSLSFYNGSVCWWNGVYYDYLSVDDFSNLVYDICRGLHFLDEDIGVLESFIRVLRRVVSVKELSVDNGKLCFRNCVLDVESGSVEVFSPSAVFFSCLSYDYDPGATCWRWHQFLDEVLPDAKLQSVLQEFVGALFIDRRKAKVEQMLILKGSGANGKSVVFEVISALLGESNVSHYSLKNLLCGGLERKRNIANINGKRLNYASETDRFVIPSDSGMLKALISGEPLEARPLRGFSFVARDIPLMMMNANMLPDIHDWSVGMRRRLTILPFLVEIPKWKQDVTLASELKKELSGIMNWALEGRKRFVGNDYKFTESGMIEALLDEYMSDTSNVLVFMRNRGYKRMSNALRFARPMFISTHDLYEDYCSWCMSRDDMPEGRNRFSRILRDAGWGQVRKNSGNFFKIYGDEALRRQRYELLCKRAAAELNVQFKGERFFNVKMIREMAQKVMVANGWSRCAVGFQDLQEYLGYTFDYKRHINTGRLEGCYVVNDGVYFFNLTAIDEKWRPSYEEGLRKRIMRRETKKAYKELMSGKEGV